MNRKFPIVAALSFCLNNHRHEKYSFNCILTNINLFCLKKKLYHVFLLNIEGSYITFTEIFFCIFYDKQLIWNCNKIGITYYLMLKISYK